MSHPVFTLDDAIRGIKKRKTLVLAFVILVPVVVMTVTLLLPKSYVSSAKLFVRLGRENAAIDATATMGERSVVSMPLTREAEINSISEMILNKSLFGEVVDEISPELLLKKQVSTESGDSVEVEPGLIDNAMATLIRFGIVNDLPLREKAIIKLQKNLAVKPVEKSNVLLIEYESHDPKLSQSVVKCVTSKYLIKHGEIHRAQGAYEFLEEQTKRLKTDLQTNESEFEQLKINSQVADVDAQRIVLVNRLAKLTDEKIEVDAQYAALSEEILKLESLIKTTDKESILEETVGVGNEGVDGMRQELYRLELQREDLIAKFNKTHFKVTTIENQILNAKKILAKAEGARKESKKGPNAVYQKMEIERNIKLPQLLAFQAKSKAYQLQIDSTLKRLGKFAQLETTFLRLNRQIAIDDANYRKYVNNLEQAKIDSLLKSQNLSNISIAQPASLELKPSKPNKLMNLVLAVGFGVFMGIGLAVYREFKMVMGSASSQIERETELPVVGSMESLPATSDVEVELETANE